MNSINPLPKALLELALDRSITLDRALNTLSKQKPADDTANRLIKACLQALERVRSKCEHLKTECEQLGPKEILRLEKLEKEGRLNNTFLEFLESLLVSLLERVYSAHTPSEVVLPIRRLTSQLLPDSDILIASTPEFNYKFGQVGNTIRDNFAGVGCADILDTNKIPLRLWLLLICAIPPSGILTHTLISHELGHGIYQTRKLNAQIISHITIKESEFDKLVEEYAALQMEGLRDKEGEFGQARQRRLDEYIGRPVLELQLKAAINKVVQDWVEEFACDAIGMCLFGPAFLLSHLYFFLPLQKLDDAHPTHPSTRMRFTFCLNSMLGTKRGLGYRKASSVALENKLAPWKQLMSAHVPKAQDRVLQLAYESIRPVLPRILSVCKKEIPKFLYDIKRFDKDIPNLCKRFSQALPPNEYYDDVRKEIVATDMISILNAAWIFHQRWLVEEPDLMSLLDDYQRKYRFLGLVQKAIEIGELKQAWLHEHSDGSIKP